MTNNIKPQLDNPTAPPPKSSPPANNKFGRLFIVSGPSQVGKDSIVKMVKQDRRLKLEHIVTNTTRAPRPGEQQGITYNFWRDEQFKKLIQRHELLEWAIVRQSYFGTPKKPVLKALQDGKNVILQIDVQGAAQIKKKHPNAVLIFITAESDQEVKRRIYKSNKMTLDLKKSRWQEAIRELVAQTQYDYVVVNRFGKLKDTVKQVKDIILNTLAKPRIYE
ncbi:MAG: guanylate kinase [Patescibacteria group bacterium]